MLKNTFLAAMVLVSTVCMSGAAALGAGVDFRLVDAAEQGDREAVQALLQQQVNVNAAQGDGMTALLWAVYREDVEMAQALLQAGADVNASNRLKSLTPLSLAAGNGNAPLIDLLLKAIRIDFYKVKRKLFDTIQQSPNG